MDDPGPIRLGPVLGGSALRFTAEEEGQEEREGQPQKQQEPRPPVGGAVAACLLPMLTGDDQSEPDGEPRHPAGEHPLPQNEEEDDEGCEKQRRHRHASPVNGR